MSKRGYKLYLDDLNGSLRKIEKYTKGISKKDFYSDEKTIDAVIRNFEILGEAVKSLPESLKKKYKEIPWREIIALRNKAIHEYFGIDPEILWQTIQNDLPDLKKKLRKIK